MNLLRSGMLCAKFGYYWLIVHVVLGNKIFEFLQCIFAILLLSPIGKGRVCLFNWTNLNPLASSKDALFQVWLKLVQWFWRRRWKMNVKSLQTDDRWRTRDQKSSLELSAPVLKYNMTQFVFLLTPKTYLRKSKCI